MNASIWEGDREAEMARYSLYGCGRLASKRGQGVGVECVLHQLLNTACLLLKRMRIKRLNNEV